MAQASLATTGSTLSSGHAELDAFGDGEHLLAGDHPFFRGGCVTKILRRSFFAFMYRMAMVISGTLLHMQPGQALATFNTSSRKTMLR